MLNIRGETEFQILKVMSIFCQHFGVSEKLSFCKTTPYNKRNT